MNTGIDKSQDEFYRDILATSGLEPHKIRNIYLYGSRVYGTHTINSDYDAIIVACSLYVNHEIFDGQYNLHITTPDSFEDQLRQHDIHCLECIFAPHEAQIYSRIDYKNNFKVNVGKLKKMLMSQSAWAWSKAQRRIERGNIIGGQKSLFHSFRILKFGLQILSYGRIRDFTEANNLWKEINDSNILEWEEYQDKWMPIKKGINKEFKRASIGIECGFNISDVFEKIDISSNNRCK